MSEAVATSKPKFPLSAAIAVARGLVDALRLACHTDRLIVASKRAIRVHAVQSEQDVFRFGGLP